jgi:hypothetical protein
MLNNSVNQTRDQQSFIFDVDRSPVDSSVRRTFQLIAQPPSSKPLEIPTELGVSPFAAQIGVITGHDAMHLSPRAVPAILVWEIEDFDSLPHTQFPYSSSAPNR